MSEPKRHKVELTEAEIDALITTIGKVTLGSVHLCRCQAVATGLGELKDVQTKLRISRE